MHERRDATGLSGPLHAEPVVDQLRKCIRTNLDCADVCATTGRVLSRHTGYDANLTRAVLQACAARRQHLNRRSSPNPTKAAEDATVPAVIAMTASIRL